MGAPFRATALVRVRQEDQGHEFQTSLGHTVKTEEWGGGGKEGGGRGEEVDPRGSGVTGEVPLKGTVDSAGPLSFLIFDSRCKPCPLPEAPRHAAIQS